MFWWQSLNPEALAQERHDRLASIEVRRAKQEMLKMAGYVPFSDRVRGLAAGWLLRLALRLDARLVAPTADAPATVPGLRHA